MGRHPIRRQQPRCGLFFPSSSLFFAESPHLTKHVCGCRYMVHALPFRHPLGSRFGDGFRGGEREHPGLDSAATASGLPHLLIGRSHSGRRPTRLANEISCIKVAPQGVSGVRWLSLSTSIKRSSDIQV
ncbi:hypothetical protein B296_00036815 [Ensete ventricosum]|uniref:Uncharacterized protein n=1 Tax=Ensete ventricosum TaxID=4639 RepID=A0A426XE22_ENSVE|nr:hypothetical protein B296_00036815 [Ensete ventricosum]